MTLDIFDPLFELQDNRLNDLGNPLVELVQTVGWRDFRTLLMRIYYIWQHNIEQITLHMKSWYA